MFSPAVCAELFGELCLRAVRAAGAGQGSCERGWPRSGGPGGRPVESLGMPPFYVEARFKSHRSVRGQYAETGAVWNNLMNTPTG